MTTWKNWAGNVKCTPQKIVKATSVEQIQQLVKQANRKKTKIRLVASGHSFTPVCSTHQIMLDISGLTGIVETNTLKKQITFWAGTSVRQAGILALQNGMAQENLGDFDLQTLAGATATGTHGTGLGLTGIAKQIVAFWVIDSNGELLECSEEKNTTLFKAGRVSIGTLGVVVKVKLQMVAAYKLKCESSVVNMLSILPQIPEMLKENRNLEFFYFPMTQKALCKKLNITNEPIKDSKIKNYINQHLVENIALKAVCEATTTFKWNAQKVNKIMASFLGNDVRINHYNKILATERKVRFLEMEYNIPAASFASFFKELYHLINTKKFPVFFPIEIRWAKKDDIWLSPAYLRDSVYFAIHTYHKAFVPEYFAEVEKLALKYEGRPHWGKMHNQTATYLKKVYPKWNDFIQLREYLDPNRIFINEYMERIFELP